MIQKTQKSDSEIRSFLEVFEGAESDGGPNSSLNGLKVQTDQFEVQTDQLGFGPGPFAFPGTESAFLFLVQNLHRTIKYMENHSFKL